MLEWPEDAFAGYLAAMIDGEGHIEIMRGASVRVRIALVGALPREAAAALVVAAREVLAAVDNKTLAAMPKPARVALAGLSGAVARMEIWV